MVNLITNLADLHQNINQHFDISELKSICLELNIDYENLSGYNKLDKCRELISYLQRRGRLNDLIHVCERQRPHIKWGEIAHDAQDHGSHPVANEISVLFLAADPTNTARLRLGEELREIQEKLQLAQLRDQFILQERTSLRPADISQALLDLQPTVVHFSGHGTTDGELCFEDRNGKSFLVPQGALSDLFEQFASSIKCVVLNACYSERQAKGIVAHIDYVVGMNQAIGDEVAIAFSVGFYQALGAGRSFDEAFKLGCVQIRLQGKHGYSTPVLLKKREVINK